MKAATAPKWMTVSIPATARLRPWASNRSPWTSSASNAFRIMPLNGRRTSSRGLKPFTASCLATSYPMKPVAPVTRTFSIRSFPVLFFCTGWLLEVLQAAPIPFHAQNLPGGPAWVVGLHMKN